VRSEVVVLLEFSKSLIFIQENSFVFSAKTCKLAIPNKEMWII
jgi:hypothetical protein